ncbi:MAG: hypothetical protein V4555_04075 [Acidobacteriota bacterium]
MTYSLTGSERVRAGAIQAGAADALTLSGNLGLLTSSPVHPFSMTYAGGAIVSEGGGKSYIFQDLTVSQQYTTKNWQLLGTDSLLYTPETGGAGLSGVPGVGSVGVPPTTAPDGVLTNDQASLANSSSGSAIRTLTGRTSAGVQGDYQSWRFVGDGTSTSLYSGDSWSMGALMQHHLNALNTLSANYTYTDLTYGGLAGKILVQSLEFQLQRSWTRRLAMNLGGGPQRVMGLGYSFASDASMTYEFERGSASVNFSRGVESGSGVSAGVHQTSVDASISHQLGYQWSGSVTGGYRDSTGLTVLTKNSTGYRGFSTSAEINRALLRHLSVFGSYTGERQRVSGTQASPLALNGFVQYFSFGITYSPSGLRIGRH